MCHQVFNGAKTGPSSHPPTLLSSSPSILHIPPLSLIAGHRGYLPNHTKSPQKN